ncbi:UNVERIFIED_CONTAM: hypothetical protein Sradi_1079800 [Sesamum radiatum]|uniref:Pentatricopeptide repeat-containing protein n=1 Tax=Sesamum radiatum TaxID=300843 RepID=A0AAW2V990_SESRA
MTPYAGGPIFRRKYRRALRMSAAVRSNLKVCPSFPLFLHISSEALVHFRSVPRDRLRICPQLIQFVCFNSSSSFRVASKFDFLGQFSPFSSSYNDDSFYTVVNSNERRKLAVGISKIIKQGKGYVLRRFSSNFCAFGLVKIMKLLLNEEAAIAFFKYVFRDHSDGVVRQCCVAVHLLLAEQFRLLAQDVLGWVIQEIGEERSYRIVWQEYFKDALDFFILDALMRSFTNVEMASCSLEVLGRMREVGHRPSVSAICLLLKLLLRFGHCGRVWKLYRDMVCKGPIPSIYIYNMMILGFCRRGRIRIGESLLYVMQKFGCEPDVHTYNILINAYCVRGWTLDALNWVHLMVESGCNPSPATFSTIINAFCKEGNIAEARKIFDGMQEIGVFPNCIVQRFDGWLC